MKRLRFLAPALLLAVLTCACSGTAAPEKALRFGALPSVDVLPFVIAEKRGYFKARGVAVDLQLFQSAKDRDAAFQAGALDGFCCDEVAVCIYRNAGTDLRIAGMTDGEYALVAGGGSGIESFAGLKGRTVAISENTLIEYVLDSLLEKNGLAPGDVTKLAVPAVPVRLEMLNAGRADAALLPEPYATFAGAGGGVRLGSATSIGLYPSVIAFAGPVIRDRRDEISAMFAAYDEAVSYLNGTPVSEFEDLIVREAGYPESMKGSIRLPAFHRQALPAVGDLRAVVAWASAKGLCGAGLAPEDMLAAVP